MTGKTDGTNSWTYTWDPDEPRLTRVQGPGGVDVSYSYDSAGRMLTRTSGGVTTTFEWDGWTCVKETTGSVVTRYVAPQGQLHSFERGGQVYQVHSDAHNGSVRAITDASGAVVAHYEFDAWGELLGSSSAFSGGFSYGYVGSLGVRTDEATGLLYMRHRWYDPSGLQRFLSRDMLGSLNRYDYCHSNPVNWVDLDGLKPEGGGSHMKTGNDGVNLYYNDASLTGLPGHLPPGWEKVPQSDGPDLYRFPAWPKGPEPPELWIPPIPIPKIDYPKPGKLPDFRMDCTERGLPAPKLRVPPWPPLDARGGMDAYHPYWENVDSAMNPFILVGLTMTAIGILVEGPLGNTIAGSGLLMAGGGQWIKWRVRRAVP